MIIFNILGAGGAVPTPTHCPAAYWVTVDDQNILLDCGSGALVRLVKSGLADAGVDAIDKVLFSHLHPDHSADLVPLLFAAHSPACVSTEKLQLFGPAGLAALLGKLKSIYGSWLEPRSRTLELIEWDAGDTLDLANGAKIRPFRVNHPQDRLSAGALGYEFVDSSGTRVVYSGDTGACSELTEAARGADLLVVECSTPDKLATPGHLHPELVGELCAHSRPRQVVLTHQYPAAAATDLVAEVGKYFDGQIIQARDGDCFEVQPPDPVTDGATRKENR